MERTKLEAAIETSQDNNQPQENDVRTLKDLELVLVGGGGDDFNPW